MKILLLTLLCFGRVSLADEAPKHCDSLNSPNDVLQCSLQSGVPVQIQNASIEASIQGVEQAAQRPNPELEVEGIKNSGSGVTTGIKLLHTFELGGKRSARIEVAENEKRASQISLLKEQEQLAVQTVIALYRLRQLETELEAVKENLSTFGKISRQYKSAGRLNPEQEISLSVFSLAYEENKLKEAALTNEKKSVLTALEQRIGRSLSISSKNLPKLKTNWSDLSERELSGSDVKSLKNSVAIAQSEYTLERSLAWPNLAIGPTFEIETGATTETRFGVALSLPLPFYQVNGGGKARAFEILKRAELSLDLNQRNLEREKQLLYSIYQKSSQAMTTTLTQNAIEAKHSNVHRLIKRGVISAPLVIELHRQILDYYVTLHEQERQGVEALWRIYALEGRILKEQLQ